MTTMLSKALNYSRSVVELAENTPVQKGFQFQGDASPTSGMGDMMSQGKMRRSYQLNHGWLYSAIHALASAGAKQRVRMGRLIQDGSTVEERSSSRRVKMPTSHYRGTKGAASEMEVILNHPILTTLESPNPMQYRWQFVYSFIANVCLTGWGYIVGDKDDEGNWQLYSIPTSWVHPIHKNGPFSEFKICDPKKPVTDEGETLTREQVAFAYLPNPADPMSAMSPADSQAAASQIDDHIQSSQQVFFKNGIFPSAVVTVGKNPHPDVPGGMRPRLSAGQRRQVYATIRKTMAGIANYGNPAILDGLIENVMRFSQTSTEMGWDKSEEKVRTRILSAFGVHPFILGEPVNVGGYAQAAKIEERFCDRVNCYTDMLGCVLTNFAAESEGVFVWWEPAAPYDPSLHWTNLRFARKNNDITQNEFRAELGLPPDEDRNEAEMSVDQARVVLPLLAQVAKGDVTPTQATGFLRAMGFSDEICSGMVDAGAIGLERSMGELRRAITVLNPANVAAALIRTD